jgi:Resolvase, N terminal domain
MATKRTNTARTTAQGNRRRPVAMKIARTRPASPVAGETMSKPMLIGYGRVSTVDQNLALQRDALTEAGCQKIFTEQMSGAVADRPDLHDVQPPQPGVFQNSFLLEKPRCTHRGMADWFYNNGQRQERPRDRVIDEAKIVLMEQFFRDDAKEVYYSRQIEVALENQFFHWITKKALNELAASREIVFQTDEDEEYAPHFYWPRRHRYPKRQIVEITRLVSEFSEPGFTHALGQHGEMLADIGFADSGFRVLARKVKEVAGRRWIDTGHDLDRLIVREADGVRYGVEIKTLPYIDQSEFQIKLAMCEHFEVRPLFITRMMPRNYMNTVVRA